MLISSLLHFFTFLISFYNFFVSLFQIFFSKSFFFFSNFFGFFGRIWIFTVCCPTYFVFSLQKEELARVITVILSLCCWLRRDRHSHLVIDKRCRMSAAALIVSPGESCSAGGSWGAIVPYGQRGKASRFGWSMGGVSGWGQDVGSKGLPDMRGSFPVKYRWVRHSYDDEATGGGLLSGAEMSERVSRKAENALWWNENVLSVMCTFLSAKSLAALSRVNKCASKLTFCEDLWWRLCRSDFGVVPEALNPPPGTSHTLYKQLHARRSDLIRFSMQGQSLGSTQLHIPALSL